jgi:hypothetical protein
VILNNTQPQYQEDILRMTIIRRFDIEVGTCACCGRQAQGRHPLQTSDLLRVGEGPEALSMAAVLNKEIGAVARAHGAGAGTGLRAEVEPERGVPGLGATGEFS